MAQSEGRISVKLHSGVSLVRVGEPILAEEMLARKTLARHILGRLSDTVLLLAPGSAQAVLDELKRMGHSPRLVKGSDSFQD